MPTTFIFLRKQRCFAPYMQILEEFYSGKVFVPLLCEPRSGQSAIIRRGREVELTPSTSTLLITFFPPSKVPTEGRRRIATQRKEERINSPPLAYHHLNRKEYSNRERDIVPSLNWSNPPVPTKKLKNEIFWVFSFSLPIWMDVEQVRLDCEFFDKIASMRELSAQILSNFCRSH